MPAEPASVGGRVLAFVRRLTQSDIERAPTPPPIPAVPVTAHVLFMDEDEAVIIYQMPWPYRGMPYHNAYRRGPSITWVIAGQSFNPARRDEVTGNWIYRRCDT